MFIKVFNTLRAQQKYILMMRILFNRNLFLLCSLIVLILCVPRCSTNPETDVSSVDFVTDQMNYLSTDTITVVITNNSTDVFYIGLRCGGYLEMFYQKKENGMWSENNWFWFMSLRCATFIDSILSDESYSYELPAEWFHDEGTYRLVIDQVYSNGFTID